MIEKMCFHGSWKLIEKTIQNEYFEIYKAKRVQSSFTDEVSIIKISLAGKKFHELCKKAESLEKEILKMMNLKSASNFVAIDDYEIIKNKRKKNIEIWIRCNAIESITKLESITSKKIIDLGIALTNALLNAKKIGIEDITISYHQIFQTKFHDFEIMTIPFEEGENNNLVEIGKILYRLWNENREIENNNPPKNSTTEENNLIQKLLKKEISTEEDLRKELLELKNKEEDRICSLIIEETKEEDASYYDQTLSILDTKEEMDEDDSYYNQTLSILDPQKIEEEEEEEDSYDRTVSIFDSNKKE